MGGGTYGGLEDALVAPVGGGGLLDLLVGGVGVDDAVLARDLLLVALAVGALLGLVLLQPVLELGLERADLRVFRHGAARPRRVRLQVLDLVADPRVQDLRLRDEVLQRRRRAAVRAADGSLVQVRDLRDVARQCVDLAAGGFHARQEVLVREHGRALAGLRARLRSAVRSAALGLRVI